MAQQVKRTALAPDDATLAAHELTQRIRDARLTAEREEAALNSTLAAAGEREAIDAIASVMAGRPVEGEEAAPRKQGKERISRAKPKPTKAELPATADDAYRLM